MIDMAHAKDQVSIADGQITLYRRDDVRDALWQCRIKMKGHRGYIRRSTGQKELEKAEQAAWQILGELSCPLKVEPLFWCQRGYLGWLESGIRMRTA